MSIQSKLLVCVAALTLTASSQVPGQQDAPSTPHEFKLSPDGQLPFLTLPAVPPDYVALAIAHADKGFKQSVKDAFDRCPRTPDNKFPPDQISAYCQDVASGADSNLTFETDEMDGHHWLPMLVELEFVARERACYLKGLLSCLGLGETLEMWENVDAARVAWKMCEHAPSYLTGVADRCHTRLLDTQKFTPQQLAERDRAAWLAEQKKLLDFNEEYQAQKAQDAQQKDEHSRRQAEEKQARTLAIMTGISEGLDDMNRRLSETNAAEAGQYAQLQAQAQAQVDANNARQATRMFATMKPAAAPSSTASTTRPDTGVAQPPVTTQPSASTQGTIVSTLCPASGFVPGMMKQNGDTAVGVPCTPGQPIGPSPSTAPPTSAAGLTLAQPLDRCVTQSYVNDNLSFTNNCTSPLYVEWYVGGHSGSWTLAAGETTHSGYSGADVTAGGSRYYACPQNYSPVDGSYNRINSAVSNYICRLF